MELNYGVRAPECKTRENPGRPKTRKASFGVRVLRAEKLEASRFSVLWFHRFYSLESPFSCSSVVRLNAKPVRSLQAYVGGANKLKRINFNCVCERK